MCGIAGVLTFEPEPASAVEARVTRMVAALSHRGPNGGATWSEMMPSGRSIALGHARLAIIDLSDGGRQPMHRRDSVVTCNGEIYNYRALRECLRDRGFEFQSASDTEVLLAAHDAWGAAFLDRLDGMFAFGLWDRDRQGLLLARDRFGIKPLYYYKDSRALVFASEIRALLASGLIDPALDEEAVWHYVGYQTAPTPMTLVRGVRMLEPGAVMQVSPEGGAARRHYWDLLSAAAEVEPPESAEAAAHRTSDLLDEAVAAHLVSDVPVGIFLSGGIDSGALVSTLAASGIRPETFTVRLDDANLDESRIAARVARHFRTDHAEIRLRSDDLLDQLPGVLAATDHPSGDAVNTYVVSSAVKAHGLKVALSGLGGDEIFGGYSSFGRMRRLASAEGTITRTPRVLRNAAATFVRKAGGESVASHKAAAVLESEGSLAEVWPVTRQLFSARARARMLSARIPPAGDAYAPLLTEAFRQAALDSVSARVSFAESRAYMHDVLLRDTDQMSMAHGLEVRVPFLDHRLASFVVALPDAWKIRPGRQKPLLVDSLHQPLPDEVADAPKRGFVLPFEAWMRGPLRSYCADQLGEHGLDGRGILKPGEARRLWKRFLKRSSRVTWARVWMLVALNAWLERRSL